MKALRWHGQRDLRLENIEEPAAKPGKVKIKVEWCGICGSDLHEYTAGPIFIPEGTPHPITGEKAPIVMGHEFSGQVVEVGEGVTKFKAGDRVTVEPIYACGHCEACKAGYYNLCSTIVITSYSIHYTKLYETLTRGIAIFPFGMFYLFTYYVITLNCIASGQGCQRGSLLNQKSKYAENLCRRI